jgi:uncharacterized protein YbjT (DUF2867 family)/uncharacterized membrane protein
MRVLILGGYGFIGLEAARRLVGAHEVVGLGRWPAIGERVLPQARWIKADIAALDSADKWAPLIADIDVVINASGALQDGLRDNLAAVQDVAIRALIAACEAQGIKRFVQVSAPGAADADFAFLRTKAVADAALKQSTLEWIILRPGLVWGRTATGGTALVRMLSAFPLVQPLALAEARVQMVDIDDVSEAIADAVDGKIAPSTDADLVEPFPRTLADVVAQVRGWHGFEPARAECRLPSFLGGALARIADLAGWLGWRSPLRTTSFKALSRGVVGDATVWPRAGGKAIAPFEASLKRRPATRQDRLFARSQWLLPLMVIGLSAFWIASGVIGFVQREAAASVLSPTFANAPPGVIVGGVADIGLGLALLWRPWARGACFGMIALTGAYLIAGTIVAPHLWSDPLGPFVKTLPAALLAFACAALLEER